MTAPEANAIAARIWDTGRAVRDLGGACVMGPTRPDGTFAACYRAATWGACIKRARSSRPYDAFPPSAADFREACGVRP